MFEYKITEHIATLSESNRGTALELNRISYGGQPPKWDLRRWEKTDHRMLKGITLNDDEMKTLVDVLKEVQL